MILLDAGPVLEVGQRFLTPAGASATAAPIAAVPVDSTRTGSGIQAKLTLLQDSLDRVEARLRGGDVARLSAVLPLSRIATQVPSRRVMHNV